MTNDQANAASLLEVALDLIRQILIKHETAVMAEFRSIIEAKKHELALVYAECDKWKHLAEFQYALRQYPADLDLGIGALDAYFVRFDYETAKAEWKQGITSEQINWERPKHVGEARDQYFKNYQQQPVVDPDIRKKP